MKKIKEILSQPATYFVILLIIIVGLIVGSFFCAGPQNFPVSRGYWEFPPDILICDVSDLEEDELRQAMKWWEERGYKFGEVFDNWPCTYDDFPDYRNIYIERTIIIYPVYKKLSGSALGHTSVSIHEKPGLLRASVIELYSYKERVIVHELGHALGWEDTNISGNIMNKDYSNGGWDDAGLVVSY